MTRNNKPVLRRKTNLFNKRIVISLPPWGVAVVAGVSALAIFDNFTVVTNAVALLMTALSVVFMFTARRMLRGMRYQIHHILNDIGNDELTDEEAAEPQDNVAPIFDMKKGKSA